MTVHRWDERAVDLVFDLTERATEQVRRSLTIDKREAAHTGADVAVHTGLVAGGNVAAGHVAAGLAVVAWPVSAAVMTVAEFHDEIQHFVHELPAQLAQAAHDVPGAVGALVNDAVRTGSIDVARAATTTELTVIIEAGNVAYRDGLRDLARGNLDEGLQQLSSATTAMYEQRMAAAEQFYDCDLAAIGQSATTAPESGEQVRSAVAAASGTMNHPPASTELKATIESVRTGVDDAAHAVHDDKRSARDDALAAAAETRRTLAEKFAADSLRVDLETARQAHQAAQDAAARHDSAQAEAAARAEDLRRSTDDMATRRAEAVAGLVEQRRIAERRADDQLRAELRATEERAAAALTTLRETDRAVRTFNGAAILEEHLHKERVEQIEKRLPADQRSDAIQLSEQIRDQHVAAAGIDAEQRIATAQTDHDARLTEAENRLAVRTQEAAMRDGHQLAEQQLEQAADQERQTVAQAHADAQREMSSAAELAAREEARAVDEAIQREDAVRELQQEMKEALGKDHDRDLMKEALGSAARERERAVREAAERRQQQVDVAEQQAREQERQQIETAAADRAQQQQLIKDRRDRELVAEAELGREIREREQQAADKQQAAHEADRARHESKEAARKQAAEAERQLRQQMHERWEAARQQAQRAVSRLTRH